MRESQFEINEKVLANYLRIYRNRIGQLRVSKTGIHHRKSVESFLLHELDVGEEEIRKGNRSFQSMVEMIKAHKEEIINYIVRNI